MSIPPFWYGFAAAKPACRVCLPDGRICIPQAMCPCSRKRIFSGAPVCHAIIGIQAWTGFRAFAGKAGAVFGAESARGTEENARKNRWQKCHAPQEYFIVDRETYLKRKNLIFAGRAHLPRMSNCMRELKSDENMRIVNVMKKVALSCGSVCLLMLAAVMKAASMRVCCV